MFETIEEAAEAITASGFGGYSVWRMKPLIGDTPSWMGCLLASNFKKVEGSNLWNYQKSHGDAVKALADKAVDLAKETP